MKRLLFASVVFLVLALGLLTATVNAGGDTKQISLTGGLENQATCQQSGWHFVITQVESQDKAPKTIIVTGATAVIYKDWDGNFNLSCPSPTAVTVTSFSASSEPNWLIKLLRLFVQ